MIAQNFYCLDSTAKTWDGGQYGFWAFIETYWGFPKLPFGIVAYAFRLFWTTFVELRNSCIRVKRKHIDNEILVLFCLWLIEQWQAEIKLLNLTRRADNLVPRAFSPQSREKAQRTRLDVLSDYCVKGIRNRILMIELSTRSDSTITSGYLTKPDRNYILLALKCPTKLRNRYKVLWKTNLLMWEVSSE